MQVQISRQEPALHVTKDILFRTETVFWAFKKTQTARNSRTVKESNARLAMISFMLGLVFALNSTICARPVIGLLVHVLTVIRDIAWFQEIV